MSKIADNAHNFIFCDITGEGVRLEFFDDANRLAELIEEIGVRLGRQPVRYQDYNYLFFV